MESVEDRMFAMSRDIQELKLGRQEEIIVRGQQTAVLGRIEKALFGNGEPGLDEQVRKNTSARHTFGWIGRAVLLTLLLGAGGLAWEVFIYYKKLNP